jgi:hypothetical protein
VFTAEMKGGFMAGKPKNRMELRRQYEAAEPLDPMEDEGDDAVEETEDDEPSEKKAKKKPKAPSKSKAKAPKPTARMRVVWNVVNDAFKTVGSFEFAQHDAALARAAELTAKGKGTHFVQRVKEPMPENAPGLGQPVATAEAAAPKAAPAKAPKAAKPAPKAAKKAKPHPVDDEEVLDDDESDTEAEEEEEEEDDEEE